MAHERYEEMMELEDIARLKKNPGYYDVLTGSDGDSDGSNGDLDDSEGEQ